MEIGDDTPVFGSFKSILQGDYLGVEYGIASHAGFLEEYGLLDPAKRLQPSSMIRPVGFYEGLVIDDYFSIALVPCIELEEPFYKPSPAHRAFRHAKEAHEEAGLQGLDAKDVIDEKLGTVVGAEINSSHDLVLKDLFPVGNAAAKRMSLSWIALYAAKYVYTPEALHNSLMGAFVSSFCFRRCGMAIFSTYLRLFHLRSSMRKILLSGLCRERQVSNIKAEVSSKIFCTDASTSKGVVCMVRISKRVA